MSKIKLAEKATARKTSQIIPFAKPQPADESDEWVDLNKLLIADSDSAFMMSVASDNSELGIYAGDSLIVDSHATPRPGDVLVYDTGGSFFLERYIMRPVAAGVRPANLFGVVMHTIHSYRKGGAR